METTTTLPVRKAKPWWLISSKSLHMRLIVFWSIAASLLWLSLFALGLLVDSKPYRNNLLNGFQIDQFISCIFTYIATNIALLSLTSAFLGGCASKLLVHSIESHSETPLTPAEKSSSHLYMSESPLSSMMRGIFIYFAFIAGVCVADVDLFTHPTQAAYIKAAGIISLLSFVVGYDPTMFKSYISLAEKINPKVSK